MLIVLVSNWILVVCTCFGYLLLSILLICWRLVDCLDCKVACYSCCHVGLLGCVFWLVWILCVCLAYWLFELLCLIGGLFYWFTFCLCFALFCFVFICVIGVFGVCVWFVGNLFVWDWFGVVCCLLALFWGYGVLLKFVVFWLLVLRVSLCFGVSCILLVWWFGIVLSCLFHECCFVLLY